MKHIYIDAVGNMEDHKFLTMLIYVSMHQGNSLKYTIDRDIEQCCNIADDFLSSYEKIRIDKFKEEI